MQLFLRLHGLDATFLILAHLDASFYLVQDNLGMCALLENCRPRHITEKPPVHGKKDSNRIAQSKIQSEAGQD